MKPSIKTILLSGMLLLLCFAIIGCSNGVPTFILTLTKEGAGDAVQSPYKTKYVNGEKVTITGVPGENHSFSHFEVNNETMEDNPINLEMRKNTTVKAIFKEDPIDPSNLIINIDGDGKIIISPEKPAYNIGDIVTMTAVPGTGWYFSHWEGDLSGEENGALLNIDSPKTVTAVFKTTNLLLNIDVQGEGSVTKSPEKTAYNLNETVTLTANPKTGWIFDHWEGDISESNKETTVTMNTNKNITAIFVKEIYKINTESVGFGMVKLNPEKSGYTYGEQVEVSVAAMSGWIFDHWGGDMSGNELKKTITIDGNKSLIANFRDYAKVNVVCTGTHSPEVTLNHSKTAKVGETFTINFNKRNNCTYDVDVYTNEKNQTNVNNNTINIYNVNKDITVNIKIDEYLPVLVRNCGSYLNNDILLDTHLLYNSTYTIEPKCQFDRTIDNYVRTYSLQTITINGANRNFRKAVKYDFAVDLDWKSSILVKVTTPLTIIYTYTTISWHKK